MRRPRNSGCVTKDKKFGTAAKLRPGRQTNGTPSPGNSHHLITVFHSLNGRLCTSRPFHISRVPDATVAAVGKTQLAASGSKRKQTFSRPLCLRGRNRFRTHDDLVPQCFLPFPRKGRTINSWDQTPSLKYRAALRIGYGAGLRASEVTKLKVSDIDCDRRLIHFEQGMSDAPQLIAVRDLYAF